MNNFQDKMQLTQVTKTLNQHGVGVFPTDTIYGLIGQARSRLVVERIYKLKGRDFDKPLIVLIDKMSCLDEFGVKITDKQNEIITRYWPGSITFIFDLKSESKKRFEYLHRGRGTLAFRMVSGGLIGQLIAKTGPVIAPSANKQGEMSADNIDQAQKSFGEEIDFYFDVGPLTGEASTLVDLSGGQFQLLRQGSVEFKK